MKDTVDCSLLHTPLHAHAFENKAQGITVCQWSFTLLAAYVCFPLYFTLSRGNPDSQNPS